MSDLDELEKTLHEGMQLGRTRSSGRRAPAAAGVPHLKRAQTGLRTYSAKHPADVRALRLLSLAEETMLNYGAALRALERAMELDESRDKRDLKRLALLKQSADEWTKLPLTPQQLAQLGRFLADKLEDAPGSRAFIWTERWLDDNGFAGEEKARVLEAFEKRGAFSDMQVYYNVVRG